MLSDLLRQLLTREPRRPLLALAPMQDITDLPFMRLLHEYGGPDVYYTEYFRVHSTSSLDRKILRSIREHETGRPVIAQMIGNDIPAMVRTAQSLEAQPVAAVDLNLGCPAPVVYKKCAGGGLLSDPDRVDRLLEGLRAGIRGCFTVKTRIGFDHTRDYQTLLEHFRRHEIDLLTVHGRTVLEGYRSEVHYDFIRLAVESLSCPVIANGNINSVHLAREVINETGASGLMIGRAAIRNPWIFKQIRDDFEGKPAFVPRGRDVLDYIRRLFEAVRPPDLCDQAHVRKMKKYLNFIGVGAEPTGRFLHAIRRTNSEVSFFDVCRDFLDHSEPMPLTPFEIAGQADRGVRSR